MSRYDVMWFWERGPIKAPLIPSCIERLSMSHDAEPIELPEPRPVHWRVLGIDPGLRVTGYAVIEAEGAKPRICEAGVIRSTDAGVSALTNRLHVLFKSLIEVLEQYPPQVMVVEQLYSHYAHPRTAILMGHARGAILLAAAERGVPVVSYNATRIKKTVTGNGRASKDQVQRTMQRELGLATLPEPPDVADAVAVALCHFYAQRLPAGEGA
jgi:crossover junction endodeoxyribonuclease RuvC